MALAVGELYASLQLDTGAFEQSMERAARLLEQGLDVANDMADALNAAADDAERMADALLKAQGERVTVTAPQTAESGSKPKGEVSMALDSIKWGQKLYKSQPVQKVIKSISGGSVAAAGAFSKLTPSLLGVAGALGVTYLASEDFRTSITNLVEPYDKLAKLAKDGQLTVEALDEMLPSIRFSSLMQHLGEAAGVFMREFIPSVVLNPEVWKRIGLAAIDVVRGIAELPFGFWESIYGNPMLEYDPELIKGVNIWQMEPEGKKDYDTIAQDLQQLAGQLQLGMERQEALEFAASLLAGWANNLIEIGDWEAAVDGLSQVLEKYFNETVTPRERADMLSKAIEQFAKNDENKTLQERLADLTNIFGNLASEFASRPNETPPAEVPVAVSVGADSAVELADGAREAAGAAGGELGALLSAGMAASLETGGGGACQPMLEAVAAQLAGMYDMGFSDGAQLSAGVAAGIRSKLGEIRAAAALARAAARVNGASGAPALRSGATVSPISTGQLRLPVAAPVSLSAPGAAVSAALPAAIAAPALEGRASALAQVGNPGGRPAWRAEPAAVHALLEIDYDRMAEAMERRDAVLVLDGRQVARLQAANAARAANARNRRIALGLGK